jgi:hypothetical protein
MYTVAININFPNKTFALTVRDVVRSQHWTMIDSRTMRDSRETVVKPFTVLMCKNSETEARKFANVIEAAYELMGFERELVKVVGE